MSERTSRAVSLVRSHGLALAGCAVVAAFAYSICRRAIVISDEGYLLSQVVDMLGGKVLYRDMDAFVSPGIWFLLAGLFKLVEPSVIASRILSGACYLATLFLSYRIVAGLSTRSWGWGAVGLLMVFTVWAFPAWTIVFYSPFAIFFALAALERLLAWRSLGTTSDLWIAGAMLGLSVAFKQNYGAFAIVGAVVSVAAFRFEKSERAARLVRGVFADGLHLAAGVAVVVLGVIAYFGYQGALPAMFDALVLHPFVFMGHQDIAFPSLGTLFARELLVGVDAMTYGAHSFSQALNPFRFDNFIGSLLLGVSLLERMHVLLFWLPVLGLLVGGLCAFRPLAPRGPFDGGLAAVLAMAAFVFLGVFPRADFNHMINVLQPAIVAGVVVVHRLVERRRGRWSLPARAGVALGCALIAAYTFVAGSWFQNTLRMMNTRIVAPRGGVLVSSLEAQLIGFHLRAIRQRTADGDSILTVPALAMLNFLSERPMPGRYYNLYEHHIAHDGGAGVVEAAEAAEVKLVIADYRNFFSDRVGLREYAPKLASYLRTHFEPDIDVSGDRFSYMRRRAAPVREHSGTDLADSCNLAATEWTYSLEHLLFESIYQARDMQNPGAVVRTSCSFTVPERAGLAFSVGYRRPAAAAPRSVLTAEVWLRESGVRTRLFSEVIPVKPSEGWATPPAKEHLVDLSAYQGRSVTVDFESRFVGRARMDRLDIGDFALVWHDPRLEVRSDRALLIGIDGATLRMIDPLVAAGRLPNLARIRRAGLSGPLRSSHPLVSPRIWTTIATGKTPLKHGIHGWVRETEEGGHALLLGSDRKVPALWNIADANGYTSGVVNWLNTYPPEKVRGVIISDFAIAGQREARERLFAGNQQPDAMNRAVTYPEEWTDVLSRMTASSETLLGLENPFEDNDSLPSWINQVIPAQSFRDDDLVARVALEIDEKTHPDVLLVYLSGIDKVSHNLWGAIEPADAYPPHIQFTDAQRAATVAALEGYYEYTDALIGRLLERYGPDDLVMVVSDHGFEARVIMRWLTGGHDTNEALDGVIFARGRRIPRGGNVKGLSIADITPTILNWLGIPVGVDMDGRVAPILAGQRDYVTPSWDALEIERVGDERAEVETSIIDQLRGLGYVE